jgi:hypothetical protein
MINEILGAGSILGIVGIILAVTGVFAAIYSTLKYRQAVLNLSVARMSVEREYYENTVKSLSDKLLNTEERWLEVNHLLIDSLKSQNDVLRPISQVGELGPTRFFSSLGIEIDDIKIDTNKVFVLTPFARSYRETYDEIAKACAEVGLLAKRGDEEYVEGGLLSHILREIASARIIIAIIDGRNPNVFYELGIAQAIGKPVMMVARMGTDAPFDLRQQQLVLYADSSDLRDRLRAGLARLFVGVG